MGSKHEMLNLMNRLILNDLQKKLLEGCDRCSGLAVPCSSCMNEYRRESEKLTGKHERRKRAKVKQGKNETTRRV